MALMRWLLGWLVVVGLLPASVWLAWLVLASVEFGYGYWYPALAIDEHIAEFAPENRFGRDEFVDTSEAERRRLFAEIAAFVDGRRGEDALERLSYRDPDGEPLGLLLRGQERAHLQDVRDLVAQWRPWGAGAAAGVGIVLATLLVLRQPLPRPRAALAFWGGTASLIGIAVVLHGLMPTYRLLHEWAFPAGAPWFFYYQDSLLTTLTKAPDLFLAIGAVWGMLTVGLYVAIYAACRRVLR